MWYEVLFSELLEEKVPLIDLNLRKFNIINYIKPTFVLFKYTQFHTK